MIGVAAGAVQSAPHVATLPAQADRGLVWTTLEGGTALKRVMGAGDLIMLAIGAVIGAGIFSSIGTAAAGEIAAVGRSRPLRRRAGARAFVRAPRRRLRAGGAVLRGARRDDPAGRQRVRLLVRDARRAGRLDHRLGPDPRVRGRQHRGGDRVERLLQLAAHAASASTCRTI